MPLDLDLPTTKEDKNVISDEERLIEYAQADHLRLFGADFGNILKRHFVVEEFKGFEINPDIMQENGSTPINYNIVYICKKKDTQ